MKELSDHERAHSGKPGAKVRHGASASRTNIHKSGPMPEMDWDDGIGKTLEHLGKMESGK